MLKVQLYSKKHEKNRKKVYKKRFFDVFDPFLPCFGLFLAQNGTFQDPPLKSIFHQKILFFIIFKNIRKNNKKTVRFLKKTSFFDRFQNRVKKGKKRGVFFTPPNPFFRGPGPSNLSHFDLFRDFRYNFVHFKTFKSLLYIKNIY